MDENNFNGNNGPEVPAPQGFEIPRDYRIPEFPISQIKRIARTRLKGHRMELVPSLLIYMIFLLVPMGILYFLSNTADISAAAQLADSANSGATLEELTEAAEQSSSGDVTGTPVYGALSVYILLLSGPFSLALRNLILRFLRGQSHGAADFGRGLKRPIQPILIAVITDLVVSFCASAATMPLVMGLGLGTAGIILGFLLSIAMFVFVIMISLRLKMAYYLAADDRRQSGFSCIAASWVLLRGHTKKYFLLLLSFIGWYLLPAIPVGIASGIMGVMQLEGGGMTVEMTAVCAALMVLGGIIFIPVVLYAETAEAVFYSNLSGNFAKAPAAPETSSPDTASEQNDMTEDSDD